MTKFRFLIVILILALLFSYAVPSAQAQLSFGKISPKDGVDNIPASSVILSWEPIENYSGTVTYRYCLQTKTKCPPGKWIRVGTATHVTVQNLTSSKTYNWWVRAYNSQNVLIAEADGRSWSFSTMPIPGPFNKLGPATGVVNQPVNGLQLTWGNSTNPAPDHYEYCLDSTNNNRCDTQWVTASSGVALSNLTTNTLYYWQVRAVNGSGARLANGGVWWSFTTTVIPDIFEKLLPVNNATNQLVNGLGLSWMISQGATSYEYCVSINNNSCSTNWQPVGTATSTSVTGLTYSTDYYWQVRARYSDNTRDANTNTWWHFSTQQAPPVTFSKTYPANLATNEYTDVIFTWQPSNGADHYEFCISTINTDVTCGDSPWDTVNGTSYEVLGLDIGETYYWQVRAVNATGVSESNSGAWWKFTTHTDPPDPFTKNTPANGDDPTETSLALTWNPTPTAGVTYQVCYDQTNNNYCEQNNWQTISSGTSFDVSGLSYGTTYYWQVRASYSTGTTYADGDQAAWWSFTTKIAPPLPFGKASPTNGSVGQPVTPLLQWSASSLGATYEYCVSTVNNDCESLQGWVETSGTSAVPAGLSYDTLYYWQVRAANSQGMLTYANGGTWWSFTTYAAPPTDFVKISPANDSINQPLSVFLVWSDAGLEYNYEYCLTSSLSLDCASWTPVNALSVQVPGLANSTTYHWQVRAVNEFGYPTYADDGAVWTFSTRPAPPTSSNATFNEDEDSLVTGSLQGSDQLTFALFGSAPAGTLDFESNGQFTYLPPRDFYGTVTFKFTVSDGINEPVGPYTVTIKIDPVNDAPALDTISVPATILSGDTLSLTATATDVDLPPDQHLTYGITNPPAGTSFNPNTGVFSWTPVYSLSGSNTYNFSITVSDGSLTDFQDITITVQPTPPLQPRRGLHG